MKASESLRKKTHHGIVVHDNYNCLLIVDCETTGRASDNQRSEFLLNT
jgi:hypothetical protein